MFFHSDNKSFDLIYCDLWAAYSVPTFFGVVYFLTSFDDYSHAVWICLLNIKDEVTCVLKTFIVMVIQQFDKDVNIVMSDNSTEFMCVKEYFIEYRILHQTSYVRTPQQNRHVESKHPHILNVAKALCFQVNLPI